MDNQNGEAVLHVEGDWTVKTVGALEREIRRARFEATPQLVDVSA